MRKRGKVLIFLLILFFLIISFGSLGRLFPSLFLSLNKDVPFSKQLQMSEDLFYRQTYNNCAPYSVMAVIHILKKEFPNPEQLAEEMPFRIYKNLTYPFGITRQLSKNGIKAKDVVLWALNDEKKLLWLKTQINCGHPVVLLIGIEGGVRHYVTVLGYDTNGFMLYDSYQNKSSQNPRKTMDDYPLLAGNRYYKNKELLRRWQTGGLGPFFRYWAVSAE